MYNQNNNNGGMQGGMNPYCPRPIIAPKKVCPSDSYQYVEQPVICPIEYRRVNHLVYYPRYYPRYEQTVVNQGPAAPMGPSAPMGQGMQQPSQFQFQNQNQDIDIDIELNQTQFNNQNQYNRR